MKNRFNNVAGKSGIHTARLQAWCFFCLLPCAIKLLLNLPSSLLTFLGESSDSTLLLVLGHFLAILGDLLLPISFCLGFCLLARAHFAPVQSFNRRSLFLIAVFSQWIPTLLGIGTAYLLSLFGLADQTASAFRAALPYYALGIAAEYAIELLWIGVFALLCRRISVGTSPAFYRKHTPYRRAVKIAIGGRMILMVIARLYNIIAQLDSLRDVVEAYGLFSQAGIVALLSLVILPIIYCAIGLTGIVLCGKLYAAGLAVPDDRKQVAP